MTPEQFQQLVDTNRDINEWPTEVVVGPDEPYDSYIDRPTIGHSFVCRDYVLAKSEALQDLGWPQSALAEIICWTEPVEDPPAPVRHGVLGVQLPGDPITWILDSRFADPYRMDQPLRPYRWEGRQIPGTTRFAPIT